MSAASNYLENELLDHVFKNLAFTSPTTTYLALFTTDPTDAGSGNEVSGGSYARQTISWGTTSGGSLSSNADINFADMPAVTVTHVGIYDASTAGNLLWHGALSSSKTVNSGDTFSITSGNLTVTLD